MITEANTGVALAPNNLPIAVDNQVQPPTAGILLETTTLADLTETGTGLQLLES